MTDLPDNEHWLPVAEAGRLLDKSPRTLRRWVTAGKLESQERDGRLWVEVSEYIPRDTTIDDLKSRVDILRSEVDKLTALNEQVTGERDYLRGALAQALRMQQVAIQEPGGRRSWWPPWKSDDN